MLKIALPNKGRLADDTRELFGDAGLPVLTKSDRALIASLGDEFEALFVRAQDIPEFVADGAADVGVTGLDLVRESGASSNACSTWASAAAGWCSPRTTSAARPPPARSCPAPAW